jgi:hypothetical protein
MNPETAYRMTDNPGIDADCRLSERDFDRKMILARLRWNLETLAQRIAAELRADGFNLTGTNIADGLVFAVVKAKPRSAIVPWHLEDAVVEQAIRRVASQWEIGVSPILCGENMNREGFGRVGAV